MTTARPEINLVVTDLDNTLYDWVSFFVSAFYAMVHEAVHILDCDREELLDDLREVHKRYHDSEHPFALLETKIVRARLGNLERKDAKERLSGAFRAFNEERDRTLALYPTVLDTLQILQRTGIPVVGHTEASAPNALFRLRKLGCLEFISRLYAIEHTGEDHPIPERSIRFDPEFERVHFLRHDQRKPNPDILLTICKEYDVHPDRVLYVGDSVIRDIAMASSAQAASAFAEYGTRYDRALWASLVRVTHWTPEDIENNERLRKEHGTAKPSVVLDKCFSQILDHFNFLAK